MCLLIETVSQVSDVAHGSLGFISYMFIKTFFTEGIQRMLHRGDLSSGNLFLPNVSPTPSPPCLTWGQLGWMLSGSGHRNANQFPLWNFHHVQCLLEDHFWYLTQPPQRTRTSRPWGPGTCRSGYCSGRCWWQHEGTPRYLPPTCYCPTSRRPWIPPLKVKEILSWWYLLYRQTTYMFYVILYRDNCMFTFVQCFINH